MTPPGLLVRPARPAEAARCAGVAAHAFAAAYGSSNPVLEVARHLERACSVPYFAEALTDPATIVLLAEVAGEAAAYAMLAPQPPPACVPPDGALQVVHFYVVPEWIGRGVAAPLMAAVLAAAAGAGASRLWLTTWEHAPWAQAFYRKQGFVTVGDVPFALGEDIQRDLVLTRPVSSPV